MLSLIPKAEQQKQQTKIYYKIVRSTCKTHGAVGERVYGVEAEQTGETYERVVIEDISANKHDVDRLIFRLKRGQVSPDQLMYIVEDYIEELSLGILT